MFNVFEFPINISVIMIDQHVSQAYVYVPSFVLIVLSAAKYQ